LNTSRYFNCKKAAQHLSCFFVGIISCSLFHSCVPSAQKNNWSVSFKEIGTNSSPRLIDLTGDGILDIVIGAGRNEGQYSAIGVIAINGHDGEILWTSNATDQIVGSAVFTDVTGDGTPDVIVGGRAANLMAIDGSNGNEIWRYQVPDDTFGAARYARYNFYSAQIVDDKNSDGLKDLIVTNGGNVNAAANSAKFRYPGVLMIISGKDGRMIAADTIPDPNETYMSPVVFENKDGDEEVLFGSGGETIGGNLYKAAVTDVLSNNLEDATVLLKHDAHGFTGPPTVIDITNDKVLDFVIHNHGGEVFAIDGQTLDIIWHHQFADAEINSSPTPAYINRDNTPDFFSHISMGKWPNNTGTFQVMFDGLTGDILYQDSIGCTGFYSGVSFDFDADGLDEILLPSNIFSCSRMGVTDIEHLLMIFDTVSPKLISIGPKLNAKNISSTPWIGDVDSNGKLDIVYVIQNNTSVLLEFFGMSICRIDTDIDIGNGPTWGGYMGSDYNGVFLRN